jgi:hypothetical protein
MNKFLPSPEKISQEFIATAIAVIGLALIVAKVPYLRDLVRNYQLPEN